MTRTSVIERAAALAEELLPPLGNRWKHVQAVAARAEELRGAVDPADGDLLVAAAWLHDIGYPASVAHTGFHPLDGARFLEGRGGFDERLIRLVAHHSGARYEAQERGLASDLAEYPMEDSEVMDALICADMTTGPAGQALAVDRRIEEILTRYPASSEVHRAISAARPMLSAAVERTLARLAAHPM